MVISIKLERITSKLQSQTSHIYDTSLFKVWEVWVESDNLIRQTPSLVIFGYKNEKNKNRRSENGLYRSSSSCKSG